MPTVILGINAFHGDSSAALVVDGKLIAAVEEERFNRVKHWAGFPAESIRYCLAASGLTVRDIDHVSVSFNPRANWQVKAAFALRNALAARSYIWQRVKRTGKQASLRQMLAEATGVAEAEVRAAFHSVEHHHAHVASGFPLSPFKEAAILSIDGMGDFVSTMQAGGQGNDWKVYDKIYYPHSIGLLYSSVTMLLGFPHYGDEYKVMGLAPYGRPTQVEALRKVIRPTKQGFELALSCFKHQHEGIRLGWDGGAPVVAPFYSRKLEELLGPTRDPKTKVTQHHQDVAHSLQVVTEEIILHLLNVLHKRHPSDHVVVVGGVAMNSVANGKITQHTPFKEAYIPAGAADNGGSFGSAFYVWHRVLGQPRSFEMQHAYWGPAPEEPAIKAAVLAEKDRVRAEKLDRKALIERTVDALCRGEVVGWFQGRMEFGARALGNRSLLADPRRTDMRDIINLKIKFREKFRPFAPSILAEHVGAYFERDEPAPFMEKVFKIREEKRAEIPAVTHVDGSGRLQSVSKQTNPLYWELIEAFRQRTGVPILLNTSLNENEPIVHTPAQALSCFLRTKMDVIVLGSHFITRSG